MRVKKVPRNILWSCVLGHGLEMYDFTLFGAFTPLIALHFFSATGDERSFVPALLALSVGYVARPFGAIIFGYIGDVYGRKRSLIITMSIASTATGIIGFCPTYTSIGIFSSVLLFIARFMQGLCVGAETSDASVFLIEHCPPERSSYGSSMIFLSGGVGCLIALFISKIFIKFECEWAWRIPFIIGFFAGAFIIYLRYRVQESIEFINIRKDKASLNFSFFKNLIQQYRSGIGQAILCGFLSGITSTTIVVIVNLYLHKVFNVSVSDALSFSVYGMIPFIISCYFCGKIASTNTRNHIIMGGVLGLLFFAGPYFYLIGTGITINIISAQIILGALAGSFIASINSFLAEQFPAEVRCTGVSVGYNTGYALTSGLYPLMAFKLIDMTENIYSPAIFMVAFAFVTLLSVYKRHNENR
ncbi:MAG: MFS transporter [Candidatus Paracaedibacteraceae bacterium]|nr:MFS transporter [Candidatus Paracaedibacteraceae bacterium]